MSRLFVVVTRVEALLTESRIRCWTAATLVVQVAVAIFVILGTHGLIVPLDRPSTTDFVSFYAAGMLTDGPDPSTLYNPAFHLLAEQTTIAKGIDYVPFFYPPVFAILCGLLAHLPYLVAFVFFELVTTASCMMIVGLIVGRDLVGWWLPFISFSPLLWNAGIGQNAALSTSLVGAATLLHRHSPFVSGLIFSSLLFKPHMGLLVALALVASRSRAALLGAVAGCVCLVAISSAWFGVGIWGAFLRALLHAQTGFARGQIVPFVSSASIFGAARLLGADRQVAYGIETVVGLGVAVMVARCWRRSADQGAELRYAALAAGIPILMPIVLFYDTTILLIASAWLIRAMRREGPLSGERMCLAAVWLGGLICYPICRALHVPIAASMAPLLMALIVRRDLLNARRLPIGNQSRSLKSRERLVLSQQPPPDFDITRLQRPVDGHQSRCNPMIHLLSLLASLRQDRRGVTALEYAIIAGVLGVTIATAFSSFGTSISTEMSTVAGKL